VPPIGRDAFKTVNDLASSAGALDQCVGAVHPTIWFMRAAR
jgi:hypothetical protein